MKDQDMLNLNRQVENYQRYYPDFKVGDSSVAIILDPGHGGMIDGHYVTSPSKMSVFDDFVFYEGVFNRYLMYKTIEQMYPLFPIPFAITVNNNEDISLSKRKDKIREFTKRFKAEGIANVYVHSIHGNAAGLEAASGIEVFTTPGEDVSDPIATEYYIAYRKMDWKMRPGFGQGEIKQDVDKEAKFAILMAGVPSILTETGFYSNRTEVMQMILPNTIFKLSQLNVEAYKSVLNNVKF
jgi:N-acetylmuramoyl-L-alanine amidase